MDDLARLLQRDRPVPSVPARIGRHDVLLEATPHGTSVYRLRGDRVLTLRANKGYREDVAAALLDAVDDLADADDLGSRVHLRPIDVPGFPLDRAALLGPGETDFFRNKPALNERGLQVVPVHRSEAADGEAADTFRWAVMERGLSLRHHDWTRAPVPRADLRRLDDGPSWWHRRSRKPIVTRAQNFFETAIPSMPAYVRLLLRDMRGYELELRPEWDHVHGTLRQTTETEILVPRSLAWQAFGPFFLGGDVADVSGEYDPMLHIRVFDRERGRADDREMPEMLPGCLAWIRSLTRTDGNFLVFEGRSGGVVQMMWRDPGPKLWLEAPDPDRRRSRGRHVTLDEAERVITTLAREDHVAVDDLGDLAEIPFAHDTA